MQRLVCESTDVHEQNSAPEPRGGVIHQLSACPPPLSYTLFVLYSCVHVVINAFHDSAPVCFLCPSFLFFFLLCACQFSHALESSACYPQGLRSDPVTMIPSPFVILPVLLATVWAAGGPQAPTVSGFLTETLEATSTIAEAATTASSSGVTTHTVNVGAVGYIKCIKTQILLMGS